jgi:hypothetical protein
MGPLDAYADQLEQIRQEIEQAGPFLEPDSPALQRLAGLTEEMNAAATRSMEELKGRFEAMAAEMHAGADKMRQEQEAEAARARGEGPPVPPPHPWEDHQGLADDVGMGLVDKLMHPARPTSPAPRS